MENMVHACAACNVARGNACYAAFLLFVHTWIAREGAINSETDHRRMVIAWRRTDAAGVWQIDGGNRPSWPDDEGIT